MRELFAYNSRVNTKHELSKIYSLGWVCLNFKGGNSRKEYPIKKVDPGI